MRDAAGEPPDRLHLLGLADLLLQLPQLRLVSHRLHGERRSSARMRGPAPPRPNASTRPNRARACPPRSSPARSGKHGACAEAARLGLRLPVKAPSFARSFEIPTPPVCRASAAGPRLIPRRSDAGRSRRRSRRRSRAGRRDDAIATLVVDCRPTRGAPGPSRRRHGTRRHRAAGIAGAHQRLAHAARHRIEQRQPRARPRSAAASPPRGHA